MVEKIDVFFPAVAATAAMAFALSFCSFCLLLEGAWHLSCLPLVCTWARHLVKQVQDEDLPASISCLTISAAPKGCCTSFTWYLL
jgi:hypothetical protein